MHNHGETTLKNGGSYVTIKADKEYAIAFRARWLGGSNKLHTRLYFNRLPQTTHLAIPRKTGTPGAVNSVYVARVGPTFGNLVHTPALAAVAQEVEVSVSAADPDGIASNVLWYSVNEGAWQSMAAVYDPALARYSATVPGQAAGDVVQFYFQAWDAWGASAFFPSAGPESRALFQVFDGQTSPDAKSDFRIIMTPSDVALLHADTNVMSNARLGCTVVYDNRYVFHHARVRLRGSERGRLGDEKVGFVVSFDPSEGLFRGIHSSVAMDRGQRGTGPSISSAVREMLVWQVMNRAGGIPNCYNELVYVIAPKPAHTRTAVLMPARYGDNYLGGQFENGDDGTTFKYELIYYPTTTLGGVEGRKLPQPDLVIYTGLRDKGDDDECYRWNLLIRNQRLRDDYSSVTNLCKTFELDSTNFLERIGQIIDVDQWLRSMAIPTILSVWDVHTSGANHNYFLQERPSDKKLLYMPWDNDNPFRSGVTMDPVTRNSDMPMLMMSGAYERAYYGHLRDIMRTSFNTNYMAPWIDHYNSITPEDDFGDTAMLFVEQRHAFLLSWLAARTTAAVPFAITNGMQIVDGDRAVLSGNGWIDVYTIRLAGYPDPLDVTWTAVGSGTNRYYHWQATVPVDPGQNTITLLAYDYQGQLVGSNDVVVTSTLSERPLRDGLRVTELMPNPPEGSDTEFIELGNMGSVNLDLTHVYFEAGVDFRFGGSAVTNLPPGGYVLIVRSLAAFAAKYDTTGLRIAGEYAGRLADEGERVAIKGHYNVDILEFEYARGRGWPPAADGAGHSLVPLEAAIPSQSEGSLYYGGHWRASTAIGGSPGRPDLPPVPSIVINEIGAHTDTLDPPPLDSDDWIELLNIGTGTVSMAGWYLSDDSSNLRRYAFPGAMSLEPGARAVLTERLHFNPDGISGFGLNKSGEQLFLSCLPGGAADRVVDALLFKGQESGMALGRYPDGTNAWHALAPSAGQTNPAPQPHLIVKEFMYHPLSPLGDNLRDEFIEIHNPLPVTVNLWNVAGAWRVAGGVDYTFPLNTSMIPGEYLALVGFDPAANVVEREAFLAAYGLTNGAIRLMGPWSGQLSNRGRGERICLERPQEADLPGDDISWVIVDEAIFFDRAPWPLGADGEGGSLLRMAETGSGNDPAAWKTGAPPSPGTRSRIIGIDHPSDNSRQQIPFSIAVSAAVDRGQVSGTLHRVEFWLNDAVKFGETTLESFHATLDYRTVDSPGTNRLRAIMVDDGGSNLSQEVSIDCRAGTRMWLTGPGDGSSHMLPIAADVSVGIDTAHTFAPIRVEFFAEGAVSLGVVSNAPYRQSLAALLQVEGDLENRFNGTNGATNLWVDLLCDATRWQADTQVWLDRIVPGSQFSVAFNSKGNLIVWHCPDPVNHPASNAWAVTSERVFPEGEFVRVTVNVDYQRDPQGFFRMRLFANEAPLTNARAWFACANTNAAWLSKFRLPGGGRYDDILVDTVSPLAPPLIRASAGSGGAIQPAGNVYVTLGSDAVFTMTAATFYHLVAVTVDGSDMGAIGGYVFTNVVQGHSIEVQFSPDLAAGNTPHWWLAMMNPGWSNDFDAAELTDLDMDGLLTWQEYIAGTHPTNPESVFEIFRTEPLPGGGETLYWRAVTQRRYSVFKTLDLRTPWPGATASEIMPDPSGTNAWTDPETNAPVFYRLGVDLE